MDKRFVSFLEMKRLFLFIGNLGASIVENVSTRAEEQPLYKTYSRRSELFRTNSFLPFRQGFRRDNTLRAEARQSF